MDIPALFDRNPAASCGPIDFSQLEGERDSVVLSKPVAIEVAKGVFAVRSANTASAPEWVRREASSQLVINTANVLLVSPERPLTPPYAHTMGSGRPAPTLRKPPRLTLVPRYLSSLIRSSKRAFSPAGTLPYPVLLLPKGSWWSRYPRSSRKPALSRQPGSRRTAQSGT